MIDKEQLIRQVSDILALARIGAASARTPELQLERSDLDAQFEAIVRRCQRLIDAMEGL